MQSNYKKIDSGFGGKCIHMRIYNCKSKPSVVHEAKILVGAKLL